MSELKIHMELHLDTALHTTGNQRRLGVDKVLARNTAGELVLPATSLKGFLREQAEVILRSWGQTVCIGPEPKNLACFQSPCMVCRVFGNPRLPSPLRFADGRVRAAVEETMVRVGVAISRHRRASIPQRLFFQETTPAVPSRITAEITGRFATQEEAEEAAALIALASRWGVAVGGGKTRGLGWIREVRVHATVDDQPIPDDRIQAIWRRWQGGSHVA